jgi:hypothetical protein
VKLKSKFIRDLYNFSKKMTGTLFLECIKRALKYRISGIASIERIARDLIKDGLYQLPEISGSNEYEKRETYQQGLFSKEADPDTFRKLMEEKKQEDDNGE